jgi:hypothetical protein
MTPTSPFWTSVRKAGPLTTSALASAEPPHRPARVEPLPNPRGYWATLSPEMQREFAKDYGVTLPAPPPKPVVFKADPLQREQPVPKPPKGHAALRDRKALLRVFRMYGPAVSTVARAIHCDIPALKAAIKQLAPDMLAKGIGERNG